MSFTMTSVHGRTNLKKERREKREREERDIYWKLDEDKRRKHIQSIDQSRQHLPDETFEYV